MCNCTYEHGNTYSEYSLLEIPVIIAYNKYVLFKFNWWLIVYY